MNVTVMQGLKVVDVTAWAFVPSAGGILAHWGADVIKVENPDAPDPMRLLLGSLEPEGSSRMFKHYSRGKRSIAVDLSTDEGRDVLYKLVADADVFLTSYLPATRKKLKIDVDDIRKVNPNIVYARGSGYGPTGPEAERPGYDSIAWWARGTLSQTTMDVSGATWPTGMVGHGDGMSGMTLAGGICAGLLVRERTGVAPVIDGSLMGTAMWFNGPALISVKSPVPDNWSVPDRKFGPATRPAGASQTPATSGVYQTKDYRFVSLTFLGDANRDFTDLVEHMGRPELATDERFSSSVNRVANKLALTELFDEIFATRTLAEWKAELVTAKGAWSFVQTPEEAHDDPQTIANGFLRPAPYSNGDVVMPVPPIFFDEEAGDPPPAPDFGQHTDEVLREVGFSEDDIARLRSSRVVA